MGGSEGGICDGLKLMVMLVIYDGEPIHTAQPRMHRIDMGRARRIQIGSPWCIKLTTYRQRNPYGEAICKSH